MNSKMTTNSPLSTNEPKKIKEKQWKQKLSKWLQQEQNLRNGDHMEGYQSCVGGGRMGEKGTGNKKHKWQAQNRQGKVKNNVGNGEAKELVCMTHGHGLSEWDILEGGAGQGRAG